MRSRIISGLLVLVLFIPVSYAPAHGDGKGEISVLEDQEYFDELLKSIRGARKRILVSMYVFRTTGNKSNPANIIRDSLISATKRGVEVKVLLEKEDVKKSSLNKSNEYTAARLAKGGVEVYFDSPRYRTHVKAVVIDNRHTFIGSHNLTASALKYNRELSLLIDSKDVAAETSAYIEEMIERAEIW